MLMLLAWRQRQAPERGGRRDPAPTLLSYRYQRLMLTPLYRRLMTTGLPTLLVLLVLLAWFAQGENRAALAGRVQGMVDAVQERPSFMVTGLAVTGADPALEGAIRERLDLRLPASSFDLDLDALRLAVTDLTAVRAASLAVRPGGRLEVAVTQRVPVAVWRYADGLRLIDAEGVMTGMIGSRADRADLPLIAGDGAKDAIGEALALFAVAEPIGPRVRGLVRMGERRWDLVLDGDLRVLLPEEAPEEALARVVALHLAQKLLDRDVAEVDLRLPDRPTLRLNRPALNVLRTLATLPDVPAAPLPEEQ